MQSIGEEKELKKKRQRKLGKDINRNHHCPVLKCDRAYGNEASLNQHIK